MSSFEISSWRIKNHRGECCSLSSLSSRSSCSSFSIYGDVDYGNNGGDVDEYQPYDLQSSSLEVVEEDALLMNPVALDIIEWYEDDFRNRKGSLEDDDEISSWGGDDNGKLMQSFQEEKEKEENEDKKEQKCRLQNDDKATLVGTIIQIPTIWRMEHDDGTNEKGAHSHSPSHIPQHLLKSNSICSSSSEENMSSTMESSSKSSLNSSFSALSGTKRKRCDEQADNNHQDCQSEHFAFQFCGWESKPQTTKQIRITNKSYKMESRTSVAKE